MEEVLVFIGTVLVLCVLMVSGVKCNEVDNKTKQMAEELKARNRHVSISIEGYMVSDTLVITRGIHAK